MSVRVRFAPSPTGNLHIGGARTALFNWMFARKHGGDFILRIEDTDQKRFKSGSVRDIMDALRWLGLDWDEGPDVGGDYGPYTQSERTALYQQWGQWLVDAGGAYACFCSAERLSQLRTYQRANRLPIGYDRNCREMPREVAAQRIAAGESYVVRAAMPLTGKTVVNDLIRGDITFDNEHLQDLVLLKSDGFPTYHLANVVDDHFMEITHIMRADEWISTAPLHVNLYKSFGWKMPDIAHMPVILSPTGKGKLSKRDQAFSEAGQLVLVQVNEYEEKGYLPHAVTNFLANVGWAYGNDVEIFDIEDAVPRFTIPAINPAPTNLPYSKLDWLNNQHIQQMDDAELAKLVRPFLENAGLEVNVDSLLTIIPAMKPRMKRLPDAIPFLTFLGDDSAWNPNPAKLTHKKMGKEAALDAYRATRDYIATEDYDYDSLADMLRGLGESVTDNGKAGPFLGTLRYAITGQKVSPPLFESILALGRERSLQRIEQIISKVEQIN